MNKNKFTQVNKENIDPKVNNHCKPRNLNKMELIRIDINQILPISSKFPQFIITKRKLTVTTNASQ